MKDELFLVVKEEAHAVDMFATDMSNINTVKEEHIALNDVDDIEEEEKDEILSPSDESILSCQICGLEFTSEDSATRHMAVHRYLGYLNDCTVDSESIYGWLEDEYMLQRFVDDFTLTNGVSFVTRTSGRNKNKRRRSQGKGDNGMPEQCEDMKEDIVVNKSPDRVMFHFKSKVLPIPELPFPFTCGNYITKDCVHGRRYQSWEDKVRKKKERENLLPSEHADCARGNIQIRDRTGNRAIKKMECKATMYIKEIIIYPKYSYDYVGATKAYQIRKAKNIVVDKLKRDINMKIDIEKKSRFYVKVPLHSAHNHTIGDMGNPSQPLDPTVMEEVQELVSEEIIGVIDEGSMLVAGVGVDDTTSSVDDNDVDFMSAIMSDNNVLAVQQEIHTQLDKIKDISYLCADVGALKECLHSVNDSYLKLSEKTPKCGATLTN